MTMVISTWAHGVNVVSMKSTTLPMADTMDEYRSSSKVCQGRLLLYDSSSIKWNLLVLQNIRN